MSPRTKASSPSSGASARSRKAKVTTDASPDEGVPFEAAIHRLEEIVDRLEGGELALEESLQVFEEGVALSRRCSEQLDSAERRIEALAIEGGEWIARPFADGESSAAAGDEDWDDED